MAKYFSEKILKKIFAPLSGDKNIRHPENSPKIELLERNEQESLTNHGSWWH
jgi:hypothetical protein